MSGLFTVAAMEIRIGLRNRWVVATTLLMTALALSLVLLGSAPVGDVRVDALTIVTVSLSSLTIFLVPLIALLLSYDALVGEMEQGTLPLVLSYPVTRTGVLLGKFIGHSAIIGFAALVGYGLAAIVSAIRAEENFELEAWLSFGQLLLSSILLGAVFVALGLTCSALVKQRGTAAGLAVAIWLIFVLLFDLFLLGFLIMGDNLTIPTTLFNGILMLNPSDVFRMLNMSGIAGTGLVSGVGSLSAQGELQPVYLWLSLVIWTIAPLSLAAHVFGRREI